MEIPERHGVWRQEPGSAKRVRRDRRAAPRRPHQVHVRQPQVLHVRRRHVRVVRVDVLEPRRGLEQVVRLGRGVLQRRLEHVGRPVRRVRKNFSLDGPLPGLHGVVARVQGQRAELRERLVPHLPGLVHVRVEARRPRRLREDGHEAVRQELVALLVARVREGQRAPQKDARAVARVRVEELPDGEARGPVQTLAHVVRPREAHVRVEGPLGVPPGVGHHGQVQHRDVGPEALALLHVAHGGPLLVVVDQQERPLGQGRQQRPRVVVEPEGRRRLVQPQSPRQEPARRARGRARGIQPARHHRGHEQQRRGRLEGRRHRQGRAAPEEGLGGHGRHAPQALDGQPPEQGH
mmetsp:Transcript_3293/g.9698  ORF Transcript_3293/g.9698 Transcript_3293/m.9698 type:complete len:349 (+) Transcript_3293:297-1343(+)